MRKQFINIFLLFISFSFILHSCQSNSKSTICKKWKTVDMYNPKMNDEISYMQHYIDTLGQNDPELSQYLDIDSTKKSLALLIEEGKKEQQNSINNMLMEFTPEGVSYTYGIDGSKDSAKYTIEGNNLLIDDTEYRGAGEKLMFSILKLNNDTLQLQLVDYGDTTTATLIPVK